MIIVENRSWLNVLRSVRGTTLQKTWGRLAVAVGASTVATYLHLSFGYFEHDLTLQPFQLIGLALGIFLGFRNNASFDRFWEGRKLWGQIVNSTRTTTRLILAMVGPAEVTDEVRERHRDLVYHVIAWVHALRHGLRRQDKLEELASLLPKAEYEALRLETNRPNAIISHVSLMLRQDVERGWLDKLHHITIENELTALINAQGGCERIKSTPIPYVYTVLLHQLVAVYCFALPFGLVHSIGDLTPFVVLLVAYAFFSLDAVGDELEDPFGEDPNDLPLATISRMIEVNLRERLREEEKPSLLKPVKNTLL
jgi:putative membrane protein